jgi:hypothetical protein
VIVPTPGLFEMVKTHGARDVTLVTGVVADTPPSEQARTRERTALGIADDECCFAYTGAHGMVNGLDMLLDAAEQVRAQETEHTRVRFVLAGDGSARAALEARLAERPIEGLTMLGTVPKARVADLLAASDVCLHLLRPDPLFASSLPTKVLEYFGNHRPFITTVPGLPQELALGSGGGFADNANSLADEIRRWSAMNPAEWHERGEQAFAWGSERYGLTATVDKLERALREACRK